MISETADTTAELPVVNLREGLSGRVILPADEEYEAARVIVPGIIDRHPALIVRVANAADVARAIEFAGENGLEVAVRSGPCSSAHWAVR